MPFLKGEITHGSLILWNLSSGYGVMCSFSKQMRFDFRSYLKTIGAVLSDSAKKKRKEISLSCLISTGCHYTGSHIFPSAPSRKWYLQLSAVIITAITDARMTKQAAIQTFTYLCTSQAKKVYTISKQKQGQKHLLKPMWWHIKPYTKQSFLSYTSCCFYLSSSVFIRGRHKDGVRGTPDNMCIN